MSYLSSISFGVVGPTRATPLRPPMRKTDPDAERPFRVPFVPVTPILGILFRLLLMFSLPPANWLRLLASDWRSGWSSTPSQAAGIASWPPNALSPERIDA